jgi:hypothetical protein
MRSVTFADLETVTLINDSFVPVWVDLGSDGTQSLPDYTAEQLAPYAEGGGVGSVGTFFALPDGRLTHEIQGWMKAASFRAEASFAAGLTAGNAAEKRAARPSLSSPLLSPLADAIRGARGWSVT